ncbi:hypothetical protein [Siccirubricoccus phaeus]|uniref:hypothetical protein n=1 Tax=Siccirubricoccus phaeus TaxID=2595053 RepID=UPI0011F25550|nr:hypothetical protein [Siccirubricoccus phaeus]
MATPPPIWVEVRERRSLFGRVVKRFFFGFQLFMVVLSLGTCAVVSNYLSGPDPEVAMGAGMFGVSAFAILWTMWPLGTVLLGILVLVTRGRKRLIPAPGSAPPAGPPGAPPHRPGGSVPEAGPRR